MQAYGRFLDILSLSFLSDGLHSRSNVDYEDKVVGFEICKHLNMTLDSYINHTSQFNGEH